MVIQKTDVYENGVEMYFRIRPDAVGKPLAALAIIWVVIFIILPIFALCWLYYLFVKFVKMEWKFSTKKSILLTLVCLFFAFNAFHYIERAVGGKKELKHFKWQKVENNRFFFSFIKKDKFADAVKKAIIL